MSADPAQPLRRAALLLACYLALLTAAVAASDVAQFKLLFAEGGPVEALSAPLWVMLAAWCLDPSHAPRRGLITCGLLALFLAMREADWQHHDQLGMSMLKLKFYLQPVPLAAKLIAAAFTLALLAVLIDALRLALGHVRSRGRAVLQPAWARIFVLGLCVMLATKGLDRLINSFFDLTGFRIHGLAGRLVGGYEEGLELSLPLIFGYALQLYRTQLRQRSGDDRGA